MKLFFTLVITAYGHVALAQPVANFTGAPLAGCNPLVVNFSDASTGNPTAWSWNFGNGNTSSLRNPTATYFTPGTYTVTLTVTNSQGSNTLVRNQYVTVYEPPTAAFTASNTSGCYPMTVQFNDLSTAGIGNTNVSWQWDFGNGITSNQQNPSVTYTTSGSFTVTLKVTNDKGCTKTVSRPAYIVINGGVDAGFTNPLPAVCGTPADIQFTNTSTGPGTLSYQWNFGDGSPISTTQHPLHTYTTPGSYIVTLITTSSQGCVDTARNTVPIVIGGFNTQFTAPAIVCVGQAVTFTNTSVPVPLSTNWRFGDGGTGTGATTTYSYSAPGTYTAWVYSTYSTCIDSAQRDIIVNPNPVADFTAPVTTRCQPDLTVNFQDLSTGGATGWQWDFGDGSPVSTAQNPTHTYTTYGLFDVRLIITNGNGCTDTIVKPDFVQIRRANINISNLPVRGCIPYTINPVPIINSVDAVTSYEWDFGDGSPASTLQSPTHTYNVQGTYTVRLIITTSTGCRDTLRVVDAVRVGSKPVANFTGAPTPVCAFQTVYFTDLSTPTPGVNEWLWDFGDGGQSIVQNPTHNYTDTGFFHVRLIAFNNGCPDTLIRNNYIYVLPPIARFTYTPDCSNRLLFNYTDQSIAPLTWQWNFGDGSPLVTIQDPVHTFPSLGVYTVQLIVTNGSCADTTEQIISAVNENPQFNADRTVACKSALINFTVTNINPANITNYDWDFGDGVQQSANNPNISHSYYVSGTYTVRLITTDVNGCYDTLLRTNYIRINGPLADFSATNTVGCVGLLTTFINGSTTDGVNNITNWRFDFGDGNIQNFSAPPFQHIYNTPGTFSVGLIITDAAGCQDSIRYGNLITTTDPIPNFWSQDTFACPNSRVTFNNTSVAFGGFTSTWDFGDGNFSNLTSPVHNYAATGVYTVKLRIDDAYGCADSLIRVNYINVLEPQASFTVSDTAGACTPLEIQFTNTSTFFNTVYWDFGVGQGTSTVPNPVHYYNTPGTYTVKLLISSPGGCLDSAFRTITVYDTSGTRLSYSPIGGCSPLSVNLNITTTGTMDSYFWDFGDGYTATTSTPNVNHVYQTFGNYVPKVIMEDPSGCLIPIEGLDTVLVTGAKANFGVDRRLLCDSGLVVFTDSTTFNDPITSYTWSFGDGNFSNVLEPTHYYSGPGNYTVYLALLTQSGCRDTLTKPNYIKVVESPLIDIAGDSIICVNDPLLQSGIFLRTDTSVVTWSWNFPNGNTSILQNPPAQLYPAAGTFLVQAAAMNSSGCTDTTWQNILVNPLPTVTLPPQLIVQAGFPVTIPAVYSPNTIAWQWSPVTGLSCGTCATPDAGPKFNTGYQVYFTDDNGCSNIGSINVIVICKNGNVFIPNTFSPNGDGVNDVFYPRGRGLERVKLLRIFNRWGEVVFEKKDFAVNDPNVGWNGTFKGQKPHADVYVFQAEVFCDNGDIIKLNGNIALIL